MQDGADDIEVPTLSSLSHESQRLVELHSEWRGLLAARAHALPPDAFAAWVGELAGRIVGHRSQLFEANATLQVDGRLSEEILSRQLEANQDAIKFCTVMLGEMNAALGRASIPAKG